MNKDVTKVRTPEEAFDRQRLSGNSMLVMIVGLFLVVGI